MADAEIKVCKIKLNIILTSIQNIRKYASDCVTSGEICIEKINVRMKRADELLVQAFDAETKLSSYGNTEELKFSEIEELYYDAMNDFSEIKSKIIQSENNDTSYNNTMHNNGMMSGSRGETDVRLPKLDIPKFAGNYIDWQPFYELFTQQIHECHRLSAVQKFRYLKSYLVDEAATLVKHMSITSANYSEALDKLRKRYDRKRYIVNSFVRKFIEQPTIQGANANNIRKIHDVCDEVIRGLKSIGGGAEDRDPWLVYLALSKLDNDTKSEWAEYTAKDEFPSFDKFLEFLLSRVDALESYGTTVKSIQIKSTRSVKSFATTTIQRCELCKAENHKLYQCKEFNESSATERRKFISDTQRCYNCLNVGHNVYNCRFRGRCQKCYRKHHSLLHEEQITAELNNKKEEKPKIPEAISTLHCTKVSNVCILPTVLVSVQNSKGQLLSFKALLDSASEVSFISERAFKLLELSKDTSAISIKGLGSTLVGRTKGVVKISISNDEQTYKTEVNAYIIPLIANMQPKSLINHETLQRFRSLNMADPNWASGGEVDILLGSDIFFDILSDGKIQSEQIIVYNTKFGWIPVGKLNVDTPLVSTVTLNVMMEVDSTLRRFWEVEDVPKFIENPEDDTCERLFLKTSKLGSDNKFIVRLPFKIPPEQLGSTYNLALKRLLSMEKRFQRDTTFKSLYHEFMAEYEGLGHMKLIGNPNPNQYYLPHHGVLKQSTTTRLRVVFDGSSKSTTNLSLNDALEIGPTIQSTLVEILLRFRQHKFVLSGDIEKMYRMVWIHEHDARYQQILWRKDPDAPVQAYQLRTVTYGTSPASFLSTRCIKEVANRIASKYPQISTILTNDVYVDDVMCGCNTITELMYTKDILITTLKQFGFNLRKLRSNHQGVVEMDKLNSISNKKEFSNEGDVSKVLGLIWDSYQDEFSFKCELQGFPCLTKRGLLSDASKLFDPLGWLSPLIINIKVLFQKLWLDPLTWDDILPIQVKEDWLKLRDSLSKIDTIKIPRWINTTNTVTLCGFCDASELAYSAVIYAISGEGTDRKSTILIAKTKVAPIKQLTLARLELQAAYMLTKLMTFVEHATTVKINSISLWTDSTLVLDWLSSLPKRWKTFVANRTSYILSQYKRDCWHHVISEENPADCATRGLNIDNLAKHQLWWNGPAWLRENNTAWPIYATEHRNDIYNYEERPQVNTYLTTTNDFYEQLISKHSSFYRICYNLSIAIKCSKYLRDKFVKKTNIYNKRSEVNQMLRPTPEDIEAASFRLCQHEQGRHFSEEYNSLSEGNPVSNRSRLKTFNPFIHKDQLIRVGGRLGNSNCNFNTKHPILLPSNSSICKPLVRDYHQFYCHAGSGLCLSLLRRKYFILKCKNIIRMVIHKCIKCVRANPISERQLMGELPKCRVEYTHAFANTGIDYCGPFEARITNRRGQPTIPVYVCIFVCLATKAVHVEAVTNMSTEGFVAALQRFVSRRGLCKNIFSDNGSNFIGANNKLRKFYMFLREQTDHIASYLLRWEIKWHFIPPAAPHIGGIWESAVKLLKINMRKVTNGHILSTEEFVTLITKIEAAINSRPLYAESNDEVDVITPAHFLIGRSLTEVPEIENIETKTTKYSRWKIVSQLYQDFRKRWYRDYLTTLQKRTKWYKKSQNLQIGDIVLLMDDKSSSCYWPLARVINIHPGRDNMVRVVTLKVPRSNAIIQRPISKVCKLPINEEEFHLSELNQIDSGRAGCSDNTK